MRFSPASHPDPESSPEIPCIAIAHIPAARFATAISARPCGCPAGATASATMAACCSSICATITGSRRWWPIPTVKAFKLAETLRSEWVVRIDGKVRQRPAGTENPDLPTGQVEVYIDEIEVLGPAGRIADAGVRRAGLSGRDPAQIPLPRSAPRASARQHHAARRGDQLDPPPHEGRRASSNSRRRS